MKNSESKEHSKTQFFGRPEQENTLLFYGTHKSTEKKNIQNNEKGTNGGPRKENEEGKQLISGCFGLEMAYVRFGGAMVCRNIFGITDNSMRNWCPAPRPIV